MLIMSCTKFDKLATGNDGLHVNTELCTTSCGELHTAKWHKTDISLTDLSPFVDYLAKYLQRRKKIILCYEFERFDV